jgi:hypothetical protein
MPIDDIDHLLENSIEEDKIITIDSTKRDYRLFPTPSEYVVTFAEPFKNVYGVEVLDTSIPRTMYNVDIHNNKIYLGIGRTPLITDKVITLRDADYTIETVCTELSFQMTDIESGKYFITAAETFKGQSKVRYTSMAPFVFNMKKSTVVQNLGFDLLSRYAEHPTWYKAVDDPLDPDNDRMFASIVLNESSPLDLRFGSYVLDEFDTYLGIVGLTNSHRVMQTFTTLSAVAILHSIEIQLIKYGTPTSTRIRYELWSLVDTNLTHELLHQGWLDIHPTTLIARITGLDIDYLSTENNPTIDGKTTYSLVIYDPENPLLITPGTNMATVNTWATYYNTMDLVSNSSYMKRAYTTDDYGAVWDILPQGSFISARVYVKEKTFGLTAPGMVNLIGERYLIIRCPEIEGYQYGSTAFTSVSPGIATINLGVIGYAGDRFDYASVKKRRFHPIGKLGRITLRFEKINGDIYDFKGVNHNFKLVIKYYAPMAKRVFQRSTLNPNYVPNFINYLRYMEEKEYQMSDDYMTTNKSLAYDASYAKREQELENQRSIRYVRPEDDDDGEEQEEDEDVYSVESDRDPDPHQNDEEEFNEYIR